MAEVGVLLVEGLELEVGGLVLVVCDGTIGEFVQVRENT